LRFLIFVKDKSSTPRTSISMKHKLAVLIVCSAALSTWGQLAQPDSAVLDSSTSVQVVSSDSMPKVGAYHRLLDPAEAASSARGKVVEVASGLNYWNGTNWVPSDPVFEQSANGFVASRIQHALRLSPELNVRGAVAVRTPQGDVLYSTPLG